MACPQTALGAQNPCWDKHVLLTQNPAGATTLGLAQGHVGGLGQIFATARF
jgi:hypothetical protein